MYKTIITIIAFLLFGVVNNLSAQETDVTAKETEENVYKLVSNSTDFTLTGQDVVNSSLRAAAGCVSTYSNWTAVSSPTTVVGCTTLTVSNITVTSTGNLTLKAPTSVLINPTFLVPSGGYLYVGIEEAKRQRIRYDYDNSGNRIVRVSIE